MNLNKMQISNLRWLWLSAFVLVIDQLSKFLAQHFLTLYQSIRVMPSFNLTLAYNKGAAFSFLGAAGGWQSWLFGSIAVVVSIAMIIWMKRLAPTQRWLAISLAFIIGGALGNLLDRIIYGHVIDFIDWYFHQWHWPVFNISDAAICVGAVMLVLEAFFKRSSHT